MVITFPEIGYASLVMHLILEESGADYVLPEPHAKLQGSESYLDAPEDICLPFKLFLAQLEAAWNNGADTVVFPSSAGPCRLGEFCELLRIILDERNCRFKWIILDSPKVVGRKEFLKRIHSIFPENISTGRIISLFVKGFHLLTQLEKLEAEIRLDAGYCVNPRECTKLLAACRQRIAKAKDFSEAFDIIAQFRWMKQMTQKDFRKNPVKIYLTGEIFSQTEHYASHYVEDILTESGVSVKRDVTLSWWLRYSFGNRTVRRLSEFWAGTYMPYNIGGYTKKTVSDTVASDNRGFDGVIQLMPAGCMPEIVGRSVIDLIAEEMKIKTMTLVFDDITGDAGYITRIEAFTDMLARTKSIGN